MKLSSKLKVQLLSPSVEEFLALRNKVGWQTFADDIAQKSLDNSLFHVAIYDNSQLIGMGRVVGDGVMYFYIQDIAVDPDYQDTGIGAALMSEIESYLSVNATEGATIGLLSVKGKEGFYARYGYIERPSTSLGHGMCKFV